MRTINITPEWVLGKLSHTLDTDGTGKMSVYTGNASDANWIELALNTLEISFEAYDYLDVNKDLVFGFDFQIEDIEYECPNLTKRVRELEISKSNCKKGNRSNDNKKVISEADRIIQEYKEENGLEYITEEEYTDLFGELRWYDTMYFTGNGYVFLSEAEEYQIDHGFDPFTGELFDDRRADYHIIDGVDTLDPQEVSTELEWCRLNQSLGEAISEAVSMDKMCPILDDYNFYIDTGLYKPCENQVIDVSADNIILDGVDTLDSTDVSYDIFWADRNLTFEQALEQASILDRFCPFLNKHDNTLCCFFYDLGDNINEYYKIVDANYEYDYMKIEEPDCIDQGEWECMLYQDLEYHASLKSREVDVYVSDISNLKKLLKRPLDETVFRLFIHWNDRENKFIIMVTDNQPLYSYKVGLQTENNDIDKTIYLGSCLDPKYVLVIIEYFQDYGKSLGFCNGLTEAEFLEGNIINNPIISEGSIDLISDLSTQRYYSGKINLDIEQALIIMLSITHFFKFEMDHKITWYNKHSDRMAKELEVFKKEEGIKDWWGEMDWIHKNGALEYNICIQDLLLQTLFTLNGSYYRINDRDYEWEEEFDKIFVDMPFGREFDRAIIKFLLLPLYNSTHNTKYILQSDFFRNNGENNNE